MRRPWTLRTRLVVSAVSLIAVVAAVIGSVTAIAFHSYLYGKLDDQLHSIAVRAERPPGPGPVPEGSAPEGVVPEALLPTALRDAGPLGFIGGGGQPLGTFGAVVDDGDVTASKVVVEDSGLRSQESAKPLTAAQQQALEAAAPGTGEDARSVELPGLGGYRVEAATTAEGRTVLVGIPTAEVSGALTTLIVVEVCVTAAGLVAASLAGTVLVGVALRPLRRVAATAARVVELPLHSGEVALLERVPDAEADPRTEVGQVGAALNRMLGHVGSALAARQESETRVRQFVADASHELRTPLASIRGYAELTRRASGGGASAADPVTRHALGRIESEADRMTGLVEDLLLLARLDAGRPLSYESTDLLPLVVDAVSDARVADAAGETGDDAHHRWRLELPDEPVTVRADPARLQQVLVNLLANARTHTPAGTTVTVSVRPPSPASTGGPVTLEVRDDGPGIPAELLPHVFERFARGDASRTRGAAPEKTTASTGSTAAGPAGSTATRSTATGSTGLGLAIVQAVVSAHGGRVRVESVPGRTVFAVELPADELPAETAAHQGSRDAGTAAHQGPEGAGPAAHQGSQDRDRLTTPV
ncbi:sensor histidine kinase [Streptomyces rhizosphaericola]|uniref:histidine kinase n=1 Tax=Streptomyces rhizosphaericola TaxID=2564098 RepID=A0ABY2PIM8_9ACTN|nr:HAMP domain-containing sensor histidine kinase [Streptomyces rhizosphaericola]TGZ10927.1 HAMP domain-containing histidine kinase [Streptomyces rhizosphaericola]